MYLMTIVPLFFLPDFFNWKKGWWGKQKNSVRFLFYEVGVWGFCFPNLLYKGFSIRVIVFWRFFQDVFSMFHVSLRCCRWSPFQNGRPWWGQILHSPILKADWTFFNGMSHIQKNTSDLKQFFREKRSPWNFCVFFLALIYLYPLKKRQLGL